MNPVLRGVIFFIGLLFAGGNLYLMTKRKLGERTTTLWLLATILCLIIAAFPLLLNRLSHMLGIDYPPALLYLVAILALLTIVSYQSTQISLLERKLRMIGQAVALLDARQGKETALLAMRESAASLEGVVSDAERDS